MWCVDNEVSVNHTVFAQYSRLTTILVATATPFLLRRKKMMMMMMIVDVAGAVSHRGIRRIGAVTQYFGG